MGRERRPAAHTPCSNVSVDGGACCSSDEQIPLSRLHLQGVRGGLQSCEWHHLRELTGCRGRGIHPGDLCGGRRGWLLREKLRQADAEALEDSGFDSVALGAGLCDLEHAVPEL